MIKTTRKFITFGKPHISEDEISAVSDVLRSGWIGTGRVSKELEDEFVKYMGEGYAIAVSSCSIGLVVALRSVGICHGDKVLTSPLTFAATVNSILQVGAQPVFSDVNEKGCLDVAKINYKSVNAIVPVHYTGSSCDMIFLSQEAYRQGIPVVEDAAHSFGGSYVYKPQGWFGEISVFSFYATKNITSGEGGMIYTKNKQVAMRCRMLSQNGQSSGAWGRYNSGPIENYQVASPGFKANMPDVLAAIGLVQLKRWPELKKKREKVWDIYAESFGKKENGHSKHLYTVRVKDRQSFREKLHAVGIGTGIHYESLHLQPAYSYLGYKKGDFPNAEKISEETVSLPLSNSMTEDDALRVVEEVKNIGGVI